MEKETSCINSKAILDYLKAHDIDYKGMIKGLDHEIDGLEDPEGFLRDPENWVSSGVISRLLERTAQLLDDEQAAYKIGQYVTENAALGFVQRIVVKAFWSIKTGLRHCQKINDQWNKSKKVELIEIKRNEATVRLHWDHRMETSRHMCLYNQGVYACLPLIWGGSRLALREKCCYFDGAPYCEYHLKWPLRNRFYEIVSRFFTSKSVLMETINEMEKDKEIINQKNDELRVINKELHEKIAELRESETALRKSEEKYRDLIEKTDDIIWVTDLALRTTYVSPSIEKKLGFTPEERMEQDLDVQMTPSSYEHITELLLQELKREQEENSDPNRIARVEVEYYHKNGSTLWFENIVSGLRDENGVLAGIHGVSRDITDRKRAEEALHQSRRMEAIATLAGGIAHEFNNALSAITSSISIIEDDNSADEKTTRYIGYMKSSAQRMARLTNKLLAYARGGMYQAGEISLSTFVKGIMPVLKHSIPPSIHLDIDLQKGLSYIKADRTQMEMVLSAVLTNAAEAIEGEGHIRVATTEEDIDDSLAKKYPGLKPDRYEILLIEDDGKGMDAETRQRIFEPFFTTNFQGRGLGMAAVYGIVKHHGGFIYVDSEPKKGTKVRIYLPVLKDRERQEEEPRAKSATGTGTILVIEDEEVLMNIIHEMLNRLGYRVLEAGTGRDAIQLAETFENTIDAALLDIKLPDMEGGSVYPLLMKERPNLKVVVFSGYSIDGPAQEILDAGAEDFLQKPFTMAELSEKLKKILEGNQALGGCP